MSQGKCCQSKRWSYWIVILKVKNFQVGCFWKRLWRHYHEGDALKVTLYKKQERILNGLYTVIQIDKKHNIVIARRRRDQPGGQ